MPKSDKPTQANDTMPFAGYCGSTLQQNYGETVDKHGFLLWDLDKKSVQAFDVANSHSYHTIKIGVDTDYDDLDIKINATKSTYIKVQWTDFASKVTRENQAKINRHLKERYKPVEINFQKTILKVSENGHVIELSAERLANISSEANQKDIFTEYLQAQQYSDTDITAIIGVHSTITDRLKQSGYQDSPGYEFKVESLWIDNFKSYGERVDLNWKGLDGIWQVTGKNTSGKCVHPSTIIQFKYDQQIIFKKLEFVPSELVTANGEITIGEIFNIFKKYGDLSLQVNTPYGYRHIEACAITAVNSLVYQVILEDGSTLLTSPKHLLKIATTNEFTSVYSLQPGVSIVQTINGDKLVQAIILLNEKEDLYDIQVAEVKQYYSNGIVSHNSTIFDAITYLFYGTMLGAMQAEKNGENRFINNIRDLDYCEVGAYVSVNGSDHKLIRRTERQWQSSKGERIIKSVSTSVNFYEVLGTDGAGNDILKDIGVDRKVQTEKVLVEYFGTMQDFMRSSFINADTLNGLFNITHSVFVDSLLRDIGLDIFERLLKEFKTWRDETHSKTKRIHLVPTQEEATIELLEADITTGTLRITAITTEVDQKQKSIDKGNDYIKEKYSLIQKVRPELENTDPEVLRHEIHAIVDKISQLYQDMNVEEALLKAMVTSYSQEAYDGLLVVKEKHQEAVNGFRAKIREQENAISKSQYEIQVIQGRMNVRERDIKALAEKLAHQYKLGQKEITIAEAELLNLETAKTCPTCKRLKNQEAIDSIQEVIAEKNSDLTSMRYELTRFNLIHQTGEDEILADIKVISEEKAPFEVAIETANIKIKEIRAEQEISVLAVDEASQNIVTMNVQRAIYDKKQRRKADLEQIPLHIENQKLKQESKVRLLEDLENAQEVLDTNESLHTVIGRAEEKVSVYQSEKETLMNEKAILQRSHLPRMTQDIANIRQNLLVFAEQERQENLLKAYEKCIHRDGIPTMLLKQYLSVINIQLGNLLDNMEFTLFINESLQFKFFNHNREDAVMNVLQGSGMQKTFASLVLRLALRQVNNKCRNNMLLMDEILGKLDPNQLERFGDLLIRSKDQIDKLVIIEHGYGDTINPDYVINITTDKYGVSTMSY